MNDRGIRCGGDRLFDQLFCSGLVGVGRIPRYFRRGYEGVDSYESSSTGGYIDNLRENLFMDAKDLHRNLLIFAQDGEY
jgi:hypothetical protein